MHIWYHNHHSTKPATFKCINLTSHFPLLSSQCIYFSSGTWFTLKIALRLKKGSNQLFKMSTLIWFLFPSSQLLGLSQETPCLHFTPCRSCSPKCQPQPQNLCISGRDEAAQLCIQDTQAPPKSFSSKTCSVSRGREVLTGDAPGRRWAAAQQMCPKAPCQSSLACAAPAIPGKNTVFRGSPRQGNQLHSHRFQKALEDAFVSLYHTKFRAFTMKSSPWHGQWRKTHRIALIFS